MRPTLLIAATLLACAAPAFAEQAVPASQPEPGQTITVTGQRIQDFRDRLAACLARHCPTDEDVDATLALAEALFLNGRYADARTYVRDSIARNRRLAAQFPEPVSDLFRASARLSRHIGLDREARTASFEILNALQAGIPAEDHRHFTARLEIAEMQMMSGNFVGARRELERLARVARAAGREDVAILAELRDRWYQLVASPGSTTAMSDLIQWSRPVGPAERMRAIGARIVLARVYRGEGNTARADALLAEIGDTYRRSAVRRLISAPRYQLYQRDLRPDGDLSLAEVVQFGNVRTRSTENFEDKWIDVGFWILPNGQVSGLETLRNGASADWAEPLLTSIRGRRYSEATEPTYRLERYTMTAGFDIVAGSRIRHRGPGARVEYIDLTQNAPDTPPPTRSN